MSDGALLRPTELAHSLVACVLRPGEVAVDATAGNGELVPASIEQLTYKQVQKGRKGRRFSLRIMQKVARALSVAIWTPLPFDRWKPALLG